MKHLVTFILNFRYLYKLIRREVKRLTHERLLGKHINSYVTKTKVVDRKASLEALQEYKEHTKWTI
jgi:hypothetical protein